MNWKDEEVHAEFRGEIGRTISYESGVTEDLHEIKEQAKKERKHAAPISASDSALVRWFNHWK